MALFVAFLTIETIDTASGFSWLASMRAKVEYPFRIVKQQFGFRKVRYRGIAKNDKKLQTMFALSTLWLLRWKLKREEA
ncbi:MAG: transposase [Comamonas sp.]